jgi:RHS repeat-associated protein
MLAAASTPEPRFLPSRYTGKERDTESGNDFFEARYYSGATGRFMSPDPIIQNELRLVNPQRWNKFHISNSKSSPQGMELGPATVNLLANIRCSRAARLWRGDRDKGSWRGRPLSFTTCRPLPTDCLPPTGSST